MNEKITIGIHLPAQTSGGGSVFYKNLIRALVDLDSQVDLVLFTSGPQASLGVLPSRLRVVELGYSNNRVIDRLFQTRRLKRAFSSTPCEAIIFAGTTVSRVGLTTHVFWPLTVAPLEPFAISILARTTVEKARWLLLKFRISRAAAKADAVIFSSEYAGDLYRNKFSSLKNVPSTVIWPAVSFAGEVRTTAIDPVPRPLSVLFVSHAYPYKRVVELIYAFGDCYDQTGVDMTLHIAGSLPDQSYAQRIRQAIADTGRGDQIKLCGNLGQEALQYLYSRADVFVFPSASENAGSYALIDAFRYGLPVISSDNSSMPEICGDAALFVDVGSREEFAKQLSRIVTDSRLRSKYSEQSSDHFLDFPSWSEIAVKLYHFLLLNSR